MKKIQQDWKILENDLPGDGLSFVECELVTAKKECSHVILV